MDANSVFVMTTAVGTTNATGVVRIFDPTGILAAIQ